MQNYPLPPNLPITAWAEDDRPREKLMALGRQVLSDAELIAILIGSGTPKESAVSLSQRILDSVGKNLNDLGKRSIAELMKFKGIGEAKAITIVAAMELARRRQTSDLPEYPEIRGSRDAYNILGPLLLDLPHEESWVLFLNKKNKVIGQDKLSIGGTDATIMDCRIVFRRGLEGMAAAIIVAHNHPSGTLRPSQADVDLTKKMKIMGETIGMPLVDHLIIADGGYFSFLDQGFI